MGNSLRARVRARALSVCGVVLGVLPLTAPGQPSNYPTKPIRFLVANAPGGGLDITARTVGPTVSNALGQQLIVDNRGGAAGSLAGEITAKAPPDGHTVLVGSIGTLAVNPHMYKEIGYHPLKDFAPITFAVSGSNILVVHNSVAAKTVPELIALARAERTMLTYGSTGSGNAAHLAAELFSSMAKVKMVHVPYKGGAPAMIALLSGEYSLFFRLHRRQFLKSKQARFERLRSRRSSAQRCCLICRRLPNRDCRATKWTTGLASSRPPGPRVQSSSA